MAKGEIIMYDDKYIKKKAKMIIIKNKIIEALKKSTYSPNRDPDRDPEFYNELIINSLNQEEIKFLNNDITYEDYDEIMTSSHVESGKFIQKSNGNLSFIA